ncbi:unnamed protein product [Bursaphelenchus okinawaensis]|uniref:C2H2-type domain-containing protein n=1 Tax=Bursaphelenchus okinawaensis TaxID=465554 RepID=A0A811JVD6_9BILA|nr:unnamed protein product [Bursaphelenchus okinawaensis]CAG9084313.1 unnamed protein product [Bursaphelenchus okinawaensis]
MRESPDKSLGQAAIAISDASLPIDMNFASFTPNSEMSTLSPISFLDGLNKKERKRRRIIGNHDNTLDGLVAKRIDLGPDTKRYQTENEAIELPNDEMEMKRLETDPDVSTRMCSICGYQGKWVSEMVRHKRVHTNERPFKCKYCSRTSKWKADLIRHVAKTHGIRVVSKYSRSKAFETQTDQDSRPKDENNNKPAFLFPSPLQSSPSSTSTVSPISTSAPFYKCQTCFFEAESMDGMQIHLEERHDQLPFDCRSCRTSFKDIREVSAHFLQPENKCSAVSMKLNFCISEFSKPQNPLTVSTSVHSENASTSGVSCLTSGVSSLNSGISSLNSGVSSLTSGVSSLTSGLSLNALASGLPSGLSSLVTSSSNGILSSSASSGVSSCASSDLESKREHNCSDCAFHSPSEDQFEQHRLGHEPPRGLFTYKCLFCSWNSKKKTSMEKHLTVHTANPAQFMPQIEKNFLAPVSQPVPVQGGQPASQPSALQCLQQLSQNQLFGATAPQLSLPSEGFNTLGLLSTLYQQRQFPQALIGSVPTSGNLNINAFKDMPANPLMAFGLCSLLSNLSKSQTAVSPSINNGQSVSSSPLTASSFEQF